MTNHLFVRVHLIRKCNFTYTGECARPIELYDYICICVRK